MNERIDKLFEQALEEFKAENNYATIIVPNSLKEKFAQLIVGECAEVCRRQQYYDADDEHKRGVNSGSYTCMHAIKQHFGVE
jgi:hypothetical protein